METNSFINTTTNNANLFNERVYFFTTWLNDNDLTTAFAIILVLIAIICFYFLPMLRKKK